MGLDIEQAWKVLFERHDIVEKVCQHGVFCITSHEINTVKEARLMAKFDQSSQLPTVFKDNHLSILPVTRGQYIIGPFETHAPVEYSDVLPIPVEIPDLQSLDYTNLYSEASALLFAYNSGIIRDVMQTNKVNLTVSGRMSSGAFDYTIKNPLQPGQVQKISVRNAQVEIDAGYESPDAFCICEAKNVATDELLIRQLFYPYRLWKNKISKPVIPVFMVYSNDIFHMFKYRFDDDDNYNSLILIEHKAYTFADEEITLNEIIELWKSIRPIPEPRVTFPQADSFTRIVDLLSILFERGLTPDEVAFKYEFEGRQTNYYIAACEYLELIKRSRNEEGDRVYQLSEEARAIMRLRHKEKYIELIRRVLQRPVFYKTFQLAINTAELPDKGEICKIMREQGFANANAVASDSKDRGALRALVWSEKVTRILKSLLTRYQKEGDAMLENTGVYVCTICGFLYIGETPPEVCPVCKVPNWKFEKVEGR